MREALVEAEKGRGSTGPNPSVGAVLVAGGQVVARGYTAPAGGPHAEIAALSDARARNVDPTACTLYSTLEPCNHHGRTGPCTDAILSAGIKRVVYGCADPNPNVLGGGNARLRQAGVEIIGPTLEA